MLGLLSATFFVGKLLQPYLQIRDDFPTATRTTKSPAPSAAEKPVAEKVVKPVERAEVKSSVKADVRPTVKADVKPTVKADVKPAEKAAAATSRLVTVTSVAKTSAVPVAAAPVTAKQAKPIVAQKPKAVPTKMMEAWAQSQVEKYSFDFDEADKDKSGNLSYSEVKAVLEKRGWRGTEDEAKKIFAGLDMTKDGKVTKVEYVAAVKKIPKISMKEMALRRAFKILDKDKNGSLTRVEITAATAKDCDLDMKAEKISDLLAALAKDDNQKLDYEEFLAVFGIQQTGMAMEVAFKLIDTDGSGFLTKDELINAVKADEELNIKAEKISALLSAWCRDDDKKISYKEFVKVWTAQKPQKK